MISHPHRAIFFHVGKTAGAHVERMFVGKLPDAMVAQPDMIYGLDRARGIYLQHAHCATVAAMVEPAVFAAYFKFTIVRNPYERLYSVYRYDPNLEARYGSFAEMVRDLPDAVRTRAALAGSHLTPQVRYTHIGRRQVVDYVGRFERLGEVAAMLNRRLARDAPLARPFIPLPPPEPPDLAALYDGRTIAIVRTVYREDFARLGYPTALPGAVRTLPAFGAVGDAAWRLAVRLSRPRP